MNRDVKFRKRSGLTQEQKRLLGALIIPFIVILLIIVILIADRVAGNGQEADAVPSAAQLTEGSSETMEHETDAGEAETESTEETTEETTEEPAEMAAAEGLERDPNPDILELMKTFFQARATADVETMNQLYGIGETDMSVRALEDKRTRMRSYSKYVTGFYDIATYVEPGLTDDAFLVYVTAEMKFRGVETMAPMLMWCYVKMTPDGGYLLTESEDLSADEINYIHEKGRSDAVRSLAADVSSRLRTALTEDESLNQIYGILNSDSPLWAVDEEKPDLLVVEESSEEDTAAGETADGESASESSGDDAGGDDSSETDSSGESA